MSIVGQRVQAAPTPPKHAPTPSRWTGARRRKPRILIVTPELGESRFLTKNGKQAPCLKAGGLADVSALMLDSLSDSGADVHIAIPHFRSLFQLGSQGHSRQLHLCQDREFCYRKSVYDGSAECNLRASLAFQRDVIHYVLPRLRPDIVRCHDWMTGLVPAAAKSMGIPSLFTVHNLHDEQVKLSAIEDRGIDAARFWQNLYFHSFPGSYEAVRNENPASLLASGILAADHMTTVSHSFLSELAAGSHGVSSRVKDATRKKISASSATGILNSLPTGCDPTNDRHLTNHYDAFSHRTGKLANKRKLQHILGLELDDEAPILFWPSRLDPVQKGCQLLADILHQLVSDYWALGLQVVFVADGACHQPLKQFADNHHLSNRIAVHPFNESLSRLGYAASDFTLMPSSYEPCGLSQMMGLRYGSLPVVHATGGLRDTVRQLDTANDCGNGFTFDVHDTRGLRWALDQAMRFFLQAPVVRQNTITRVMSEANHTFQPSSMVDQYVSIYRQILARHNESVRKK